MRNAAIVPRAALLCVFLLHAGAAQAQQAQTTGPARGALVIAGGGTLGEDIMRRFIQLAGGRSARIVIMPGADTRDTFPDNYAGYRVFRDAGVQHVTVLHTRSREVANTMEFVQPLREATGVWIPGGRQWRLVDAFHGTRTVRELHALLERGGVIGGTSAGASIQSSYMVRGAVEGNTVMMAPGYEEGFGFLRNAAVDQHLLARNRQEDMLTVIAKHSALLGVGLDEGTAIVVRGNTAEVIGRSYAAFYNTADRGDQKYYFLKSGDVFDLSARRTVRGTRLPPQEVVDQRAVVTAMNRLFEAMRSRDTATIRSLAHPDLRLYVPGVQNDTATLRVSTIEQFMRSIAAATVRLDERAFDPEVRIDGNLASVWTYYEFRRGEEFSHCGVDAFHFARTSQGWKMIALAYTTRTTGCRN
jgi:cyanophycinase